MAVCDVDVRKGENAVRELQTEYGADRVIFIKTDVTNVAELEGNVETIRMLSPFLTWACQMFKKKGLFFITLRHRTCLSELCEFNRCFSTNLRNWTNYVANSGCVIHFLELSNLWPTYLSFVTKCVCVFLPFRHGTCLLKFGEKRSAVINF